VPYQSHFTVEDLLQNESFLNFYFKKDEADTFEWEEWSEDNPERLALVSEAFATLNKLSLKWSEDEIKTNFLELIDTIQTKDYTIATSPYQQATQSLSRYRWLAAASVALLVGISFKFFISNFKPNQSIEVVNGVGKYTNRTSLPISLLLPDSSKVVLEPESNLEYAIIDGYRDVTLTGEALFDVKRNPNQPFLVHTGDITTKVLGTSFRIKSDPDTKDVHVTVIHGKVRIFRTSTQAHNSQEEDVAVLTTNLTATYFAEQSLLQAGISESPVLVNAQKTYNFVYNDTPLSEVLATMSEAYGVKIVVADDDVLQCPLTANLNNLNMYEQLDLICQTLNETHHETIRSTVLISGKGCR
jgi:ferric-dicitrate binding protein FerR (iron transport regulator)